MVKVGFAGSRFKYFKNFDVGYRLVYDLLCEILSRYSPSNDIIYHGANWRSIDAIVDRVARELGFKIVRVEPKEWIKSELAKRTIRLVEMIDILYCIFVGKFTRGTSLAERTAKKMGKEVHTYFIDTEKGEVYIDE